METYPKRNPKEVYVGISLLAELNNLYLLAQ